MGDRYNIFSQMEHLQSKYVGTGHSDTTKWEWMTNQHRDTLASYLGEVQLTHHAAHNHNKAPTDKNVVKENATNDNIRMKISQKTENQTDDGYDVINTVVPIGEDTCQTYYNIKKSTESSHTYGNTE
uniref:Probable splicing factor 3B subunit 5 n=1 Tax=Phallusia mammillata TaxID=59560 RepID=A0A6F9DSQ3_9ASCI|nr:probable splicing factor 3B subunit 5 [Phallusia mammillata]